jgi:hypothetical protein
MKIFTSYSNEPANKLSTSVVEHANDVVCDTTGLGTGNLAGPVGLVDPV